MHPKTAALLQAYVERRCDLSGQPPQGLDGMEVLALLWPLNDVFRPMLARIRTLPYVRRFEAAADDAIEAWAEVPDAATWSNLEPGVWRVLLERHQQALTVVAVNVSLRPVVMMVPALLPERDRPGFAAIYWLHRMKLLMPVRDRSTMQLPAAAAPGSMTQH